MSRYCSACAMFCADYEDHYRSRHDPETSRGFG